MLLVLIAWLMEPALNAGVPPCTMQCCQRRAQGHHEHLDCSGMNPAADESRPQINASLAGCKGTCLLQGLRTAPLLPSNGTEAAPFLSCAPYKSPVMAEGAEPKLLTYAGRAPPISA
jgi:hypothetical protein